MYINKDKMIKTAINTYDEFRALTPPPLRRSSRIQNEKKFQRNCKCRNILQNKNKQNKTGDRNNEQQ